MAFESADLNDDVLDRARNFVRYMASNGNGSIDEVLNQHLNEEELEAVRQAYEKILKGESPIAALDGSTTAVASQAGLSGEEAQQVIALLKFNGNLLQVGPGRGKCLLLLSDRDLDMDTLRSRLEEASKPKRRGRPRKEAVDQAQEQAEQATPEPRRRSSESRASIEVEVPDAFRDAIKSYEDMQRQLEEKDRMIDELKGQLAEMSDRFTNDLRELSTKLEERMATSW